MKSVFFHMDISLAYLGQFIKTRIEYKLDFMIGAVTGILSHIVALIFIDVLFVHHAYTLNGWTQWQVVFIYGFSILPHNLFSTFFMNLYWVGSTYIVDGHLDRVMVRPINPLVQVLMERVAIDRIPGMILGIAILYYASVHMDISWTPVSILLLILFSLCGMLIYGGVFTAVTSLSFWMPDRMGLLPPIYNLMAFGKYPVTIYHPILQVILKWIIPFAFVAFFPSTHFMGKALFRTYVLLTPVMAVVTFGIGYTVWTLGLRKYESTGS